VVADNWNYIPNKFLVHDYAMRLARIQDAIETNLRVIKTPFLVSAPKDKVGDVQNALDAINNKLEVVTDPNFDIENTIKVLNFKVDVKLLALEDEYDKVLDRFCEEIGYHYLPTDKREQVVLAETSATDGVLASADVYSLKSRLNLVKWLGTQNVTVKLNKMNSDIYNDFTMLVPEEATEDISEVATEPEGQEEAVDGRHIGSTTTQVPNKTVRVDRKAK
jgi:hypothetical protein